MSLTIIKFIGDELISDKLIFGFRKFCEWVRETCTSVYLADDCQLLHVLQCTVSESKNHAPLCILPMTVSCCTSYNALWVSQRNMHLCVSCQWLSVAARPTVHCEWVKETCTSVYLANDCHEIQDGGDHHSEIHFNVYPGHCVYRYTHKSGTASKTDVSEQRAIWQRSDYYSNFVL